MKAGYRMIQKLGSGGMACVYLVEQCMTGRYVAYKTIKEGEDKNKEKICRLALQKECELLKQVSHPGIPAYLDEDKDGFYMTYIKGASLAELVKTGKKPPVKLLKEWMIEACDIISYLHQMKYLYLDMKPQNLMLDECGALFLIDYGACVKMGEKRSFVAITPRLSSRVCT